VKAALVISDRDNVATALEPLAAGRRLELGVLVVTLLEDVPSGHKVALRAIAAGQPVVKYGSSIGLASADIAAGAHVHTHNLASSRGRGDLAAAPRPDEPSARLAEPSDEGVTPARRTG
jgi:altronate dehydratase